LKSGLTGRSWGQFSICPAKATGHRRNFSGVLSGGKSPSLRRALFPRHLCRGRPSLQFSGVLSLVSKTENCCGVGSAISGIEEETTAKSNRIEGSQSNKKKEVFLAFLLSFYFFYLFDFAVKFQSMFFSVMSLRAASRAVS
jgi:hypothetical protein